MKFNELFFRYYLIPKLIEANNLSQLLELRLVSQDVNQWAVDALVQKFQTVFMQFNETFSWPLVKLLIILKSPESLQKANGDLFFKAQETNAVDCMLKWFAMDFCSTYNQELLTWNSHKALWTTVESSEFPLRSALKILLTQAHREIRDDEHIRTMAAFFKKYDNSITFAKIFAEKCPKKPELSNPTHILPIKDHKILDLKNQQIRARRKSDFCRMELDIDVETATKAVNTEDLVLVRNTPFAEFVEWIMSENDDKIKFFQLVSGMCISGDVNAKKFMLFLYGKANSGKTTTIEILRRIFLNYFISINERAIIGNKTACHDSEMIQCGAFASTLFVDEAADTYKLQRGSISRILGVNSISCRAAGEAVMQEVHLKKYLLALVNQLPTNLDSDTLAKTIILEFSNQRAKHKPHFVEDFLCEDSNRQDVCLFALTGALYYWRHMPSIFKFVPHESSELMRRHFGKEENHPVSSALKDFVRDHVVLDNAIDYESFTPSNILFERFQQKNSQTSHLSQSQFVKELKRVLGEKFHCKNPKRTSEGQKRGFYVTLNETEVVSRLETSDVRKKMKYDKTVKI